MDRTTATAFFPAPASGAESIGCGPLVLDSESAQVATPPKLSCAVRRPPSGAAPFPSLPDRFNVQEASVRPLDSSKQAPCCKDCRTLTRLRSRVMVIFVPDP